MTTQINTNQVRSNDTQDKATVRTSNFKTMLWLIKREYWENKGLFLWAPLAVSVVVLIFLWTIMLKQSMSLNGIVQMTEQGIPLWSADERLQFDLMWIKDFFRVFVTPLFWLSALGSVFYLMSSMHSERQDKSILFWKSLPVSDFQTVFSKMVFPLFLSPLLCFLLALCAYVLSALIFSVLFMMKGDHVFELVFLSHDFLRQPLMIFSLFPMYALWAMPTVGWILLVSAWAKSRVMPWAYGVPLLSFLIAVFINFTYKLEWNMLWWGKNIVLRMLGGTLPGSWTVVDPATMSFKPVMFLDLVYEQTWQKIFSTEMALGILAGFCMIAIAIRMRKFNDPTR